MKIEMNSIHMNLGKDYRFAIKGKTAIIAAVIVASVYLLAPQMGF